MKSTPEYHLFLRIAVLMFLLGLVFGPSVLFIGIRIYNFIQASFDPLASHIFHWPLDAFQIILGGASLVLILTVADLWSQFVTGLQRRNNRHALFRFCDYFIRIVGFLLMGGGVILLIEEPLNISYPKLSSLQELAIDIILILLFLSCTALLSWYFLVRDKRRAVKGNREADSLYED